MKKIRIIITILFLTIIIVAIGAICLKTEKFDLLTVKSEKELYKLYEGKNTDKRELFLNIFTIPFGFLNNKRFIFLCRIWRNGFCYY